MKKYIFILVVSFTVCVNAQQTTIYPCNLFVQEPTYNFWDWRTPNDPKIWQVYLKYNGANTQRYLASPFWRPSESNENRNLTLLRDPTLELEKDYQPSEGWELVKRGFGSNSISNDLKTPYLVLYNKYTSALRVFINIINSSDYTKATIQLNFFDTNPNLLLYHYLNSQLRQWII